MLKKLLIEEYNEKVSYRALVPKNPICMYIIAHGAGAGIDHPFIETIQQKLFSSNIASFGFNFIYKEKGKKLPGGKKALSIVYKEVWKYVRENYDLPIFIGGKSMGARISTKVINELENVKGFIFLGYPVHPPGRPEKFNSHQLFNISHPMLFLQGSRDNFSTEHFTVKTVESMKNAELVWLPDGKHSWETRKKDEFTQEELMDQAISKIVDFCKTNI